MHIDQSKFVPVRHKCILFNHFSLCTLNNTSLRQHGLFNKNRTQDSDSVGLSCSLRWS